MSGTGEALDQPAALAADFWDYALALYGRDGVQAACLRLQDQAGFEVNLLLFCCFAAARGLPPLSPEILERLIAALTPWRQAIVAPLRRLRRATKTPSAPAAAGELGSASLPPPLLAEVHAALAAAELVSERAAQHLLCLAYPHPLAPAPGPAPEPTGDDRAGRAAANLTLYTAMAARPALAAAASADLAILAASAGQDSAVPPGQRLTRPLSSP
mgnify:FL=1